MKQQLATLTAEVTFPERKKFTAPLFLLPGLWSGSWAWNEAAWGFSQRGWECWALDRYHAEAASQRGKISFAQRLHTFAAALSSLDEAPIVLAFDVGSVFALLAAERIRPRALVCIAPLLPRNWTPERRPALPLVRLMALPSLLWGRPHPPPYRRMAQDFLFHGLPTSMHDQLHALLEPDSGRVIRTLIRDSVPLPPVPLPCPAAIVWGQEDRMNAPTASRWLADFLHADSLIYPDQGHWLLSGPQTSTFVADVHRWLIRTLGGGLLLPPEDDA